MEAQIKTKNVHLTEGLEDYIRRRLQKLDRVNERVVDAKMEVRVEKNRSGGELSVAQLTISTGDSILRAEEKNHDLHTAIDLTVDRMSKQIRRFHDKRVFNRRRQRQQLSTVEELTELPQPLGVTSATANGEVDVDLDDEVDVEQLVRRKRFRIQTMD
jgi:putative sigma-54 modulation protein